MRILILATALAAAPAFAQNQTAPAPEATEPTPAAPKVVTPPPAETPTEPPPPSPAEEPAPEPAERVVSPPADLPERVEEIEPGFSPDAPYPDGFADPLDPYANDIYAEQDEGDGFPWGLLGLLGLLGLFGLAGRREDRNARTVYVDRTGREAPPAP